MGVPVIGCDCAVCRSTNPHNNRLRAAALVNVNDRNILIDCGPDFRQQALRYGITDLDGTIITHAHHDHTASIDELRIFYLRTKRAMPCLMSKATAEDLIPRYRYIFHPDDERKSVVTKIQLQLLEGERGEIDFQGVIMGYVTYEQKGMEVNGFIIGDLAYISDIRHYPESIFEDLQGVETLVISALRFTQSDFHLTVDEAVEFIDKVGAKKGYLTHIAHELEHEKTNAYLPEHVRVAYDGLELTFNY